MSPVEFTEGSGGRGCGRSQIIRRRESLALYNHSILSVPAVQAGSTPNHRKDTLLLPVCPYSQGTSCLPCYNSYLCTCDLYSPVHNVLDACISIMRASGRGLGPGSREFLGPVKWHRADRRGPVGAQKFKISRTQPAPTCSSNGYAHIQNIMHRAV